MTVQSRSGKPHGPIEHFYQIIKSTFSGLDDTKFDAQTLVTLDNVSKVGFWEAAVDATTVDGTDLNLAGRTAILDTGTTLIIMPQADADAIHQNIQGAQSDGQGGFTVPCNTQASVAMTFGGTVFAIDPRDIAFQPLDPNNPNGDCISGIAAGNIGAATQWLVCTRAFLRWPDLCMILIFRAGWRRVLEECVLFDGC
jgi:hypothetical protein